MLAEVETIGPNRRFVFGGWNSKQAIPAPGVPIKMQLTLEECRWPGKMIPRKTV
jgi:hypothetical protein